MSIFSRRHLVEIIRIFWCWISLRYVILVGYPMLDLSESTPLTNHQFDLRENSFVFSRKLLNHWRVHYQNEVQTFFWRSSLLVIRFNRNFSTMHSSSSLTGPTFQLGSVCCPTLFHWLSDHPTNEKFIAENVIAWCCFRPFSSTFPVFFTFGHLLPGVPLKLSLLDTFGDHSLLMKRYGVI